MIKDIYLIILKEQDDTYVKIVDKETHDWINSDIVSENDTKRGSWTDFSCPLSVRERKYKLEYEYIKEPYDSFEGFYPDITSGSYNNDRATWVTGLIFDDVEANFDSEAEALKFIKKINLI